MGNDRAARIALLGSLNLDLVLHMPRMPEAGETLASDGSAIFCGGKGANQAVACARMGSKVAMIGRLGDDPSASMLRASLEAEGIDHSGVVTTSATASGTAVILLTPDGQNRIMLIGGANAAVSAGDISAQSDAFEGAKLLICQLEVPMDAVTAAIDCARLRGIPVLLNPAPARPLPTELIAKVDYLIPNESEAALLTGIAVHDVETALAAARALRGQGARNVIVTLGAGGILVLDGDGHRHLPALPAEVVDTTAAGDSFIGGFSAGLVEGMALDEAAGLGLKAARICVGRAGAQASLPYRREVA
jgi:ribokinase